MKNSIKKKREEEQDKTNDYLLMKMTLIYREYSDNVINEKTV